MGNFNNFMFILPKEGLIYHERLTGLGGGQTNPSWGKEKNLGKSDHLNTGRIIPQYNFQRKNLVLEEFFTLYKIEFQIFSFEYL